MTRTLIDGVRWMTRGTELIQEGMSRLSDDQIAEASVLDNWTRKHLVAHIAANADALRNLVHWARTGEERPMYSSPSQRNEDIEAGSTRPAAELRAWVLASAHALGEDVASLTAEQWSREVVTAQGRTVPASEIPWLRSREALVHATDLGAGVTFADLPTDLLSALAQDIVDKRSAAQDGPAIALTAIDTGERWSLSGSSDGTEVQGRLADIVAYLAGRPHDELTTPTGAALPALSKWL